MISRNAKNSVVMTPPRAIRGIFAESDAVNRAPAAIIPQFLIWNLWPSILSIAICRYLYSFIIRGNQLVGSDVTAEPAAWRVAGAVRSPLAPSILRLGRDSCFAGSGGLCSCIRPRYSDGKSQPLGLVPAAAKWLTDPPGEVCTADLAIVYRDWMQTVCERRYGFLVHEHREKAKRAAAAKRRPGEAKQQQLRQIEPKQPKAKPPQPMAKKARRQLASQRRKIAMGQPSQRTSRTAATSSYTTPNS